MVYFNDIDPNSWFSLPNQTLMINGHDAKDLIELANWLTNFDIELDKLNYLLASIPENMRVPLRELSLQKCKDEDALAKMGHWVWREYTDEERRRLGFL